MKEIPLSKGHMYYPNPKNKGKYVALVDDEDYEWLSKFNWSVKQSGNTAYAFRSNGEGNTPRKIKMHREIMGITDPKIKIDHKDRNGLNCQRNNLREATDSENMKNRIPYGSSKYMGVIKLKNGRWRTVIISDKKPLYLGTFDIEEDAARAYDVAAKIHHREFANLNFPEIKNAEVSSSAQLSIVF